MHLMKIILKYYHFRDVTEMVTTYFLPAPAKSIDNYPYRAYVLRKTRHGYEG